MDDSPHAPELERHPLLLAAADALTGARSPSVRASYDILSDRYRAGADTGRGIGRGEVLAYTAARLPATLAAMTRVLRDLAGAHPDWRPESAIDLGAGPGTAGWAVATSFPSLRRLTFVEHAAEMAALGRRLARGSELPAVAGAPWVEGDALEPPGRADLVLASYVLGELGEADRESAVTRWWDAAEGCLVIVEPGTPAGYARVIAARELLIARGARVLAPCPHDRACPLPAGDWCHFGARAPRTALHRSAKRSVRGFEDEKYSYVVVGGLTPPPGAARARVIRRPLRRPGHVQLTVCGPDGVSETVVARRQRAAYAAARHIRWGDRVSWEIQAD